MNTFRASLIVGLAFLEMAGNVSVVLGTKGVTDKRGLEEADRIRKSLKIEEITPVGFRKAHVSLKDAAELTRMGNLYRKSLQRSYVEDSEITFKFLYRMAEDKKDLQHQSFAAWKLAKIYSRSPLENAQEEARWISKGLDALMVGGENEDFLRWLIRIPIEQYGVLFDERHRLASLVSKLRDYALEKELDYRLRSFKESCVTRIAAPFSGKDTEGVKAPGGRSSLGNKKPVQKTMPSLSNKDEWPALGSPSLKK